MPLHDRYVPKTHTEAETNPFLSAEEAWFWFIQAHSARMDGARIVAGAGTLRPCEPVDILAVVERLYRSRRLMMDHILVLRFYGRRLMSPDPCRAKEMRAHSLWKEAIERMEEVLINKGIVKKQHWVKKWLEEENDREQGIVSGADNMGGLFG